MTKRVPLLLLAGFVAGCTSLGTPQEAGQPITNAQGHVIGRKDVAPDPQSGQPAERVVYYVPEYDANGVVVAYEEPIANGFLIRALDGRKIGVRYVDLRSRAWNTNKTGVKITVPADRAD